MEDVLKIEIKDFQSIKHAVIEVPPGITIITGKTNQGKSAVIRAIDSALFNMGDDSMVRGGKRYSGVSLDNGKHKMVFCRDSQGKNEKTAYQFDDGPTQKKVGRSQLPEVAQMFNIRDVRMQNNTKMKINFWYQNDKPFLMDKTSGQLYEFLSLSSCDKYTKILKKMIVDMKVQEADINNITTEIDTLKVINNRKTDFIQKNEGFDDLYVRVITADQEDKELIALFNILKRTQELRNRMSSCSDRLKKVSERYSKIPIESLIKSYESVDLLMRDCSYLEKEVSDIRDTFKGIKESNSELVKVSDDYSRVCLVYDSSNSLLSSITESDILCREIFSHCSKCKTLSDSIQRVKSDISNIDSKKSGNIDEIKASLDVIDNSIRDISAMKSVIEKLDSLLRKIEGKKNLISEIDEKLKTSELELEKLKKSAGYCPFCGTIFEH